MENSPLYKSERIRIDYHPHAADEHVLYLTTENGRRAFNIDRGMLEILGESKDVEALLPEWKDRDGAELAAWADLEGRLKRVNNLIQPFAHKLGIGLPELYIAFKTAYAKEKEELNTALTEAGFCQN